MRRADECGSCTRVCVCAAQFAYDVKGRRPCLGGFPVVGEAKADRGGGGGGGEVQAAGAGCVFTSEHEGEEEVKIPNKRI